MHYRRRKRTDPWCCYTTCSHWPAAEPYEETVTSWPMDDLENFDAYRYGALTVHEPGQPPRLEEQPVKEWRLCDECRELHGSTRL